MPTRYKIIDTSVTLTSGDTEYSWTIPEGARGIELKLDDAAVAWRWSATTGLVAGGNGYPMVAGAAFNSSDVDHTKQTVYFACSSAGKKMKIACSVPLMR